MDHKTLLTMFALAALLALAGCPTPSFSSEEGQWSFDDFGLVSAGSAGLTDDRPVLEGSAVHPRPRYQWECPEATGDDDDSAGDDDDSAADMAMLLACFEHSAEGPGTVLWTDSSLSVRTDGPGELTWHMQPVPCGTQDGGCETVADRVTFDVVGTDVARARLYQWADVYAVGALFPPPGEVFPDDLVQPADEPYQVMAGVDVLVLVDLWDPSSNRSVAWNSARGAVSLRSVSGSFEITAPADEGWVGLRLGEGSETVLELEVDGNTWSAATLIGVGEDALASVELVTAYTDLLISYPLMSIPQGARALFRDAPGRPVHGVPVQWRVRKGTLAVGSGPGDESSSNFPLPGGDYARLSDVCLPPSKIQGARNATLEASYGDLSDSMELHWFYSVGAPETDDTGWERPQECLGSDCSCTTTGRTGVANVLLPLMLLAATLRRASR